MRPLAGVLPACLVVAALLFGLRLAGVPGVAAFVAADLAGVVVAVAVGRARAGEEAALGLAVVLTLAYSMLIGVLVVFVLALVGAR